jgi:uncharacterized protein (TIGR03089 family)
VPSAGYGPDWRRVPTLARVTSTTEHLTRALSTDPSGPRLTFYDDGTGERVELSTTTLVNWVAKTTNLLVLQCGVGPGSLVSLHLPRHWVTAVWALAADAVGADVILTAEPAAGPDADGTADRVVDVAVVGPDNVPQPPAADEVFAVSLAPLAAPFTAPLPPPVQDFTLEVRGMPDQVTGPVGPPGRLGATAEQRARALGLRASDRVAALGDLGGTDGLIDQWLAPLAVGANVVWVRNPDPALCVSRWDSERVTAVVGTRPAAVPVPDAIRILA